MLNHQLTLDDFDYSLPEELIAQYPAEKRDESRLFVVHRKTGIFEHVRFMDITDYLNPGELLVFNNARVSPARIYCRRTTGGAVELVLTEKITPHRWVALCKRKSRLSPGEIIHAEKNPDFQFVIEQMNEDSIIISSAVPLNEETLGEIGAVPLPPYIRRTAEPGDAERYQTVYARQGGAAASPTAGLHFTEGLMERLRGKGVDMAFLTLMVSWGTFYPLRYDIVSENRLHSEQYIVPEETARVINNHRGNGRRIVAVGTTSLRVMETAYSDGSIMAGEGETDLFIYPPRPVLSADSLITNFHTPRSSLLMLVSAFAGYELIRKAYAEAVEQRYRFFSYGDAMFITD